MAPTRPALRWHGGKWKLASWIIGHFPPHRVYTEVYGGAASVLMQKARSYSEVYNDLDGEVVNLFRVLRDPATARNLARALALTPFSREEYVESYDRVADPVDRARRLLVRSFQGHGSNSHNRASRSGFWSNSNRSGTTPAHDWGNFPPQVPLMAERFRSVVIENRPAVQVLRTHDGPRTLHYVDPPYPMTARSDGRGDYAHEMTDAEHRELREVLGGMEGFVIVSGYRCPLYDELYRGWASTERLAYADGAAPRTEVLWMNARAAAEHAPLFRES